MCWSPAHLINSASIILELVDTEPSFPWDKRLSEILVNYTDGNRNTRYWVLSMRFFFICWLGAVSVYTWQEQGFVHCLLLGKADVTEVFLALPDRNDTSALFKQFHDELLCRVLRQTTHKHRLTSRGSLSGGRGREVFEEQKHIIRLNNHFRISFIVLSSYWSFCKICNCSLWTLYDILYKRMKHAKSITDFSWPWH